jgi:hypothetical protein
MPRPDPSVGTWRLGPLSRLPAVHLAHQWPCLLVLLQGLSPHHCGLHLSASRPGLSVGTRRPWPPLSAPWLHPLMSALPGLSTQELLITLLLTRIYTPPSALLLILHPSWSLMARVFLSHPWVPSVLMALCLPNVLVAPSMVHNLLSIRKFTADNSCSFEFDSSSLAVNDLASRHPSFDATTLHTLRFPTFASSSLPPALSAAFATTPCSTIWHRRLSHPGRDALTLLSRNSDIRCPRAHEVSCVPAGLSCSSSFSFFSCFSCV